MNQVRDPTPDVVSEEGWHCCRRIARECIGKTLLVEQFLLPLLQHLDVPGGVIREFKTRWREVSLIGKTMPALRNIARRHRIPITPGMTDQELRSAILAAEEQPPQEGEPPP